MYIECKLAAIPGENHLTLKSQDWPNSIFSQQKQYIIKGKCCENWYNNHPMGKALMIYKQIFLTNCSRKCMEIKSGEFVLAYWDFNIGLILFWVSARFKLRVWFYQETVHYMYVLQVKITGIFRLNVS